MVWYFTEENCRTNFYWLCSIVFNCLVVIFNFFDWFFLIRWKFGSGQIKYNTEFALNIDIRICPTSGRWKTWEETSSPCWLSWRSLSVRVFLTKFEQGSPHLCINKILSGTWYKFIDFLVFTPFHLEDIERAAATVLIMYPC